MRPKIVMPSELERILRGEMLSREEVQALDRRIFPERDPSQIICGSCRNEFTAEAHYDDNIGEVYISKNISMDKIIADITGNKLSETPKAYKILEYIGFDISELMIHRAGRIIQRGKNRSSRVAEELEKHLHGTKDGRYKGVYDVLEYCKRRCMAVARGIASYTLDESQEANISTNTAVKPDASTWAIPQQTLWMYRRLSENMHRYIVIEDYVKRIEKTCNSYRELITMSDRLLRQYVFNVRLSKAGALAEIEGSAVY